MIRLTARPLQDKNIKEQVTNTTKSCGNIGPLLLYSLLNSNPIIFPKIAIKMALKWSQNPKKQNHHIPERMIFNS